MFVPTTMTRIDLLVLERELSPVLRALAEAQLVHLRPVRELSGKEAERDVSVPERYRQLAGEMRGILLRLGEVRGEQEVVALEDVKSWERWTKALKAHLEGIDRRIRQLTRLEEDLRDNHQLFHHLKDLPATVQQMRTWRHVRLFCGRLSSRGYRSLGSTLHPHLLEGRGDEVLMALLVPSRQERDVKGRLDRLGFEPLNLFPSLAGSFEESSRRCARLAQKVREHRVLMESRVDGLSAEHRRILQSRLAALESDIELLDARRNFQFTERAVVLSGWIPEEQTGRLKSVLADVCGTRFAWRRLSPRDEAPVLLRNPGWVRPFEKILAVLGTPGYREIEPTPLLALGFILLFGMMFGDLGHGLTFMVLGLGLLRFSRFRDQGLILLEVGGAAAVFGILFGSVFGFEDVFPPLWFSPLHNVTRLMAVALLLGAFLIVTGLCLRIVNGLRHDRLLSVLTHRNGVAGLLFYLGALAGGFLVWKGALPAVALSLLALPLAAVFLHPFVAEAGDKSGGRFVALIEGGIEILETILGFLANTFSFLRVAAFGLAHVGLALAVFALADAVEAFPLGALWVFLVHLFGNIFIMALEGLVVSIQAVRLEFYEFFSRFFEGGGVPYRPLTLRPKLERRF